VWPAAARRSVQEKDNVEKRRHQRGEKKTGRPTWEARGITLYSLRKDSVLDESVSCRVLSVLRTVANSRKGNEREKADEAARG